MNMQAWASPWELKVGRHYWAIRFSICLQGRTRSGCGSLKLPNILASNPPCFFWDAGWEPFLFRQGFLISPRTQVLAGLSNAFMFITVLCVFYHVGSYPNFKMGEIQIKIKSSYPYVRSSAKRWQQVPAKWMALDNSGKYPDVIGWGRNLPRATS